jgi:oligoendopeptidase F
VLSFFKALPHNLYESSSGVHVMSQAQAVLASSANDLSNLPTWDLTHLYPSIDSAAFFDDLTKAEADAKSLSDEYRGKIVTISDQPDAAQTLFTAIKRFEALDDLFGRLGSYAFLVYAGDTQDPVLSKFYSDVMDRLTAASSETIFFSLELNHITDERIASLLTQTPLDYYRPWLEDIRREKPHQLSDEIERVFNDKSTTGSSAWRRLFDETVASLRFHVRGEELSLEPTLTKLQDMDETIRQEAAQELSRVFKANLRIFTFIMNTLVKDKSINDRWHHFEDVADSRHLSNRVERDVVDALVSAARAAYPRLSHRYYALKAKWFGKETLNHWDRNAPLPKVEQRTISWEEARETVLTAYSQFDPSMANIAQRFFDERWIDAPSRKGKASGAFAHPTVPSAHPYVLLNYLGKPRDVMTLAHELGHGVHQMLAAKQGALMASTPLTLAETASVFGEMLTFRKLLNETQNPVQRKALLASKVEDMINTVVRQIAFYTFERKVHTARANGELTSEQLCDLWMSVQSESLGPAITLNEGYDVFWVYVSHFVRSPFYVYAYAFGDCLVNSLYGVYQKSPDGFVERYFDLLKAGGTKHHSELLAPFGLDARDPAFWQIGLNMIDELITELESMD